MLRIRLIGVVVGSSLEDKVQRHIVVAIAHRAVDARQGSGGIKDGSRGRCQVFVALADQLLFGLLAVVVQYKEHLVIISQHARMEGWFGEKHRKNGGITMALVYSYIRFSSKRQELGDSLRRQKALGDAWLDRHPDHHLADLRLRDLGKSAFRGKHLEDKGDLGKFVHLVNKGQIPKGSILLLERMDRFSREKALVALGVLSDLLNAGITIVTLEPERVIDAASAGKMETLLPVVIEMIIAHEQSLEKSKRVGAAWTHKRAQAANKPLTKRCPAWLELVDGKFKIKHGSKTALQYAFEQTCNGIGQRKLAADLNKKFHPIGRSGKWNQSYLNKILGDRSVLGEFQPHKFTSNGKRVPDGKPIPNYFPQVIEESLFDRAQAALKNRQQAKGPSGKFVNLFVGLVKMSDGHPAHVRTSRVKRAKGVCLHRRLISYGYLRGIPGSCPISVDYWAVERALLIWFDEKLQVSTPKSSDATTLLEKQQELDGVETRLAELSKSLEDPSRALDAVLTAVGRLEQRKKALKLEIEGLRQAQATEDSEPIEQTKHVIQLLEQAKGEELHLLRLKLRGLIAAITENISIKSGKHGRNVRAKVEIQGKNRRFAGVIWI